MHVYGRYAIASRSQPVDATHPSQRHEAIVLVIWSRFVTTGPHSFQRGMLVSGCVEPVPYHRGGVERSNTTNGHRNGRRDESRRRLSNVVLGKHSWLVRELAPR
jgi:hypothetical protein